uniref:Poly(A) RNA polymerase GLD2-B n=3 Tax=Lygus hesperus TaxID=30085 RepID=A0A146LRR0_LYGHE
MADNGEYGPPMPPQSFHQRHFGPPQRGCYGFNEYQNTRFPRGRKRGPWRGNGWFRGGGRNNRYGGYTSPLKRDRSTMEESGDDPTLSPAEKIMRTHSNFHRVKKIARTTVKKYRKATQDVKLPPGSVDASLPTFEAQALDLISKMELSDDQKRGVQQVLLDLTTVLRTLIEDIDPIVYGSMCTGLALGTSDIDCFMDSKVVPDGAVRMETLLKNRSTLFKSRKFDSVIGIPKARVPILKATHIETGIEVDMNCTTSSGIHNSALIKYLVHYDERIRQLVLLIQTFYRSCKISGTNKVTSYAVTLLVIYYLQRLPQPILPPLCKILFVGEGQTWPASFERTIGKHIVGAPNNMTLTELFSGFFKFYAAFDFTKVISLYLGCELESSLLTNEYEKLPAELAVLKSHLQNGDVETNRKGFHEKPMMVQDPIEHHLNTTWNVPLSCFELFISLNQTYWELLTKKPETLWLVNMMPGSEAAESKKKPQLNTTYVVVPPGDSTLPPIASQVKPQKLPPVSFSVDYPMEGCDKAWPEHLIPDFTSVFNLLLIESSVLSESANEGQNDKSRPIIFNLETHYNVFKTRFGNIHGEVISDPMKYNSVKSKMIVIRDRMKKPESSFCASLAICHDTGNELKITVRDQNRNLQNVFAHMAQKLQENLSKLLSSVRTLRESVKTAGNGGS